VNVDDPLAADGQTLNPDQLDNENGEPDGQSDQKRPRWSAEHRQKDDVNKEERGENSEIQQDQNTLLPFVCCNK
jgi:hypothetical protein